MYSQVLLQEDDPPTDLVPVYEPLDVSGREGFRILFFDQKDQWGARWKVRTVEADQPLDAVKAIWKLYPGSKVQRILKDKTK